MIDTHALTALCLASCGNWHGTKRGSAMKNNAGFESRKEPPAKAAFKRANGIAQSS